MFEGELQWKDCWLRRQIIDWFRWENQGTWRDLSLPLMVGVEPKTNRPSPHMLWGNTRLRNTGCFLIEAKRLQSSPMKFHSNLFLTFSAPLTEIQIPAVTLHLSWADKTTDGQPTLMEIKKKKKTALEHHFEVVPVVFLLCNYWRQGGPNLICNLISLV